MLTVFITVQVTMHSPLASTSVVVDTPEIPITNAENREMNEKFSTLVNVASPARKYIEPHPHETSADYNMRVQWQQKGKFEIM